MAAGVTGVKHSPARRYLRQALKYAVAIRWSHPHGAAAARPPDLAGGCGEEGLAAIPLVNPGEPQAAASNRSRSIPLRNAMSIYRKASRQASCGSKASALTRLLKPAYAASAPARPAPGYPPLRRDFLRPGIVNACYRNDEVAALPGLCRAFDGA